MRTDGDWRNRDLARRCNGKRKRGKLERENNFEIWRKIRRKTEMEKDRERWTKVDRDRK